VAAGLAEPSSTKLTTSAGLSAVVAMSVTFVPVTKPVTPRHPAVRPCVSVLASDQVPPLFFHFCTPPFGSARSSAT
jgi:hypothetical protein